MHLFSIVYLGCAEASCDGEPRELKQRRDQRMTGRIKEKIKTIKVKV